MKAEHAPEDKRKRTRKLKYGETTQAISARLPVSDAQHLSALGGGNLSKGLVVASNVAKRADQTVVKKVYEELGLVFDEKGAVNEQ